MKLGSKTLAGTFSYYRDGSRSNAVSYMYAHDLDGDGVDEVLFVSFETQPNTPDQYSNTSVHLFGWSQGLFQDLTSQWFSNRSNEVEGVGDVAFGDFNADGHEDVFLSAYTDMNHPVNAYVLYNTGGGFNRVSLGLQTWMHSVRSADINQDGYDDVIPTGYADMPRYMGSATGLVKYSGFTGGSGLAIGDFMNTGKSSVVFVDAGNGLSDTFLYALDFNTQGMVNTQLISQLPGPRLESATPSSSSHDIRAVPIDFNDDGLLDVITMGYGFGMPDDFTHRSEVQFLMNKGQGLFSDVTETYRVGYDVSGYVGYTPQVLDVDLDGRLDLFMSMPDWMPVYRSTTLLLQAQDHTFVDTARSVLTGTVEPGGGQALVVQGPDHLRYLVTESAWSHSDPRTKVNIQTMSFPEREASESLTGTRGEDQIHGQGGDDRMQGAGGNDWLDGGSGLDTAVWTAPRGQYEIGYSEGAWWVQDQTGRDGRDMLVSVERLEFAEDALALDLQSRAGVVAKTLGAVFGKHSVLNKEYVGIGLYFLDQLGWTESALMQMALDVRLGSSASHAEVVDLLYTNVVGHAPDDATRQYFVDLLDTGAYNVAGLGWLAAETELNKVNIELTGLMTTGAAYIPFAG